MRLARNSREILAIKAKKLGLARKSQDGVNDYGEDARVKSYPIGNRSIRYGNGVTDIVNDSVTPFLRAASEKVRQPSLRVCL